MSSCLARLTLLSALSLSACIRLRNPNADASTSDAAIGDGSSRDGADPLDASDASSAMDSGIVTDMGVVIDTGIDTDTSVVTDTGVIVDTGVVTDTGAVVDAGVRCPDLCGPAAALRSFEAAEGRA